MNIHNDLPQLNTYNRRDRSRLIAIHSRLPLPLEGFGISPVVSILAADDDGILVIGFDRVSGLPFVLPGKDIYVYSDSGQIGMVYLSTINHPLRSSFYNDPDLLDGPIELRHRRLVSISVAFEHRRLSSMVIKRAA